MKKQCTLLLSLLLLACLCMLPAFAESESEILVMIYLCGTDLESEAGAASYDLLEMLDAGLIQDGEVAVLVQAGGTRDWQSGILESGESGRFLVTDDLYPIGESLGKLDMGAPETLRDFIRYGMESFPAKRVALVLWDHGCGATGGVCYDELTGNSLSMGELYDALAQGLEGQDMLLDFIGFDACLMSTYEVAAHLAPFAKMMIASEELEPGSGWAYDKWLGALARDPSMDAEAIGRVVVDSFIESSLASDPNDYVTLAVTNLQELEPLKQAVAEFGQTLVQALEGGQFPAISRARAQMRAFGDFADASSDMVDIAEAAWYCREVAPEAAKVLTNAVKAAVVYSRNSANIQSAAGLSILLPEKTKADADEYLPSYDEQALMEDYTVFLEAYLGQLTNGSHSFALGSIQPVSLGSEEADGGGWLAGFLSGQNQNAPEVGNWDESDSDGGLDWTDYQNQAAAYGDAAYSLSLSAADMDSLSYVEAALLQDAFEEVGDEYGDEVYFDFGLMQDVYVDWDNNTVYGLFDGTWPTLEGQMVPMYDQVVTEEYARSLIPALVNDIEQYLLVVFNDENPHGVVAGYSRGYDSNGNPVRGYEMLRAGDVILPLYDLIYWDENAEMQIETYTGTEIIMGTAPPAFSYEDVEPGDYCYAFCLNDIYGDYQFSDFFSFSYQ